MLTAQVFIKLSAQLRDRGTSGIPPTVPETPQPSEKSKEPTKQVIGDFEATVVLPRGPKSNNVRIMFGSIEVEKVVQDNGGKDAGEVTRISLTPHDAPETQKKADEGRLIPRLGAQFWDIYGNKLRVFGTNERVCHIG